MSRTGSGWPLGSHQWSEARTAIFENASDLLEEAEVLRRAGFDARACALAELAVEEAVKAYLFAVLELMDSPSEPRLRAESRRVSDHAAKLALDELVERLEAGGALPRTPEQFEDLLEAARARARARQAAKLRGFYATDGGDGTYLIPNLVFVASDSADSIAQARRRLDVFASACQIISATAPSVRAGFGRVLADLDREGLTEYVDLVAGVLAGVVSPTAQAEIAND